MKFRFISASILLSTCFLATMGTATAAEVKTEGRIEFSANTDPAAPVDPTNPEEPINPNRPPTEGPLSISYTTDISFGTQTSSTDNQVYYAENAKINRQSGTTTEIPNFVQVSDASGSSTGWKLFVQFDQPLTSTTSGHQIAGTTMSFKNIITTSHDGFTNQVLNIGDPVTIDATTQQQVLVAEAAPKEGQGQWTIMFGDNLEQGKKSIALNVPGESEKKAEKYTTSLTWSMVDGK